MPEVPSKKAFIGLKPKNKYGIEAKIPAKIQLKVTTKSPSLFFISLTDLISEFTQAGVNQTLHRIYLNVDCSISILTPFDTVEETITNQVLLAEAVIVGDVPATYYNLNGVTNDDLMEVME